jgi:hypothetical protein
MDHMPRSIIPESPKDTVWKAVKAALKEYGREYPKTWAGRLINTIWGGP